MFFMSDIMDAAQTLIIRLNAAPQYHSVWVRSEVDPVTHQIKQMLCVSIRPAQVSKIKVPNEHLGFPVVHVPWPKGS